ncbi:MAG TPA: fibronectin type III domain-containing protein, partial [Phycisphaerae bacterium]|nr:fibronectin type III domain-containing protein [Phycisphaerae bacterium]
GEGTNSTGLYVNGAAPTNHGAIDVGWNNSNFNLRSYDVTRATIAYDGTTLTVTLKDLITNATVTQNYTIDIPATIGGNQAWVGFTAASGHFGAYQAIWNWTYTQKPSAPTVPNTPTGVAAAGGVGSVQLNWNNVNTALSYIVKYGTTAGGPYTTTVPAATNSANITGLTAGTPYYFIVTAINGVGESLASSEVNAVPVVASAPAAPTGLTASAGNHQVVLNWTAVGGATSYNVKYGTNPGGPYTTTLNVATVGTTISNLTNGTPYYFVVSALNANGEGINSTQASATPTASQMTLNYANGFPTSTGLTINGDAQVTGGKLLLTNNFGSLKSNVYATQQQDITGFTTTFDYKVDGTWPLGDGFTFVIQRAGVNASGVGGGGLGYGTDHTGGTGGIANSLAIKFDLYDNQGEGTNSTGMYLNGAAPTNVGAIWLGGTGFDMRSYNLTRATISYDGTTLKVVLKDLVTGASVTQNYTVDIPATIGGTSAWVGFTAASGHFGANQAIYNWTYTQVPVVATPPAAPTGVTPVIGSGQVGLSWNSVAGATSYNIKYGTTDGGPYTTVVPSAGTNAVINGLTNNTTYYFVVTAVNGAGEGSASTQVSATPLAVAIPVPSAPTGVGASAGNAQVSLNWNPVAGAVTYNVKYGTVSGGPYGQSVNGLAGTSTNVLGLTNNTPYYFVVTAVNGTGESLVSTEVTATPTAGAQGLNFSTGFAGAGTSLQLNGSSRIDGSGNLLLTTNSPSQLASVYAKAKQNIAAFTTSFDFEIGGSWPLADGFTFTIQNAGQTAIGQSNAGMGYGATNLGAGIGSSVAIKFDVNDNAGEGNNSTGLYINGATPSNAGSINLDSTGVDLRSYNPMRATLTYDGTTLTVVIKDLVTNDTATQHYTVDIQSIVGGSTAWVGFTASDNSILSAQTVTKWTYTA